MSSASSDCALIEQTESACMLIGILNLEWAVRPPSNSIAAIPDEATARAMSPDDLTLARSIFSTNVFPVPPGPSMKKMPPCSDL